MNWQWHSWVHLPYHPEYLWAGSTRKPHMDFGREGRENLSAWLCVSSCSPLVRVYPQGNDYFPQYFVELWIPQQLWNWVPQFQGTTFDCFSSHLEAKPNALWCDFPSKFRSSERIQNSVYAETATGKEPGLCKEAKLNRPKRSSWPSRWWLRWSQFRVHQMMVPRDSEETRKTFLLQVVLGFHSMF